MAVRGRTWRQRQKKDGQNKAISLSEKPEYIALFKWAKKNGVIFNKIKPALFPGIGRGLVATGNIENGDSLISVPKHLLITRDMIICHYFSGQFLKMSSVGTCDLLCLFLIIEHSLGRNSSWFPYLAMLPTNFTTPSYFTEKELEILPLSFTKKGRAQSNDIEKCLVSLKQLVNYVAMQTKINIDITFENVKWAWNIVNTRSVYMDSGIVGKETKSCALAPLLDLLNHSCDVEVNAGYVQATQCYDIQTKTRFEKYSQVLINYGPHSNRKLFIEYGFILPSNCHDSIKIEPSVVYDIVYKRTGHGLSAQKYNIIRKYHLEDTYLCLFSGISWSLATALKIIALDDAGFTKRALDIENIDLSADDQCLIMVFSRNILKSLVEKYDFHLERMCCWLNTELENGSQDRIYLVVELLKQEREILKNALVALLKQ